MTCNVETSIATVSCVVRWLAITHKHVAKEALEREEGAYPCNMASRVHRYPYGIFRMAG